MTSGDPPLKRVQVEGPIVVRPWSVLSSRPVAALTSFVLLTLGLELFGPSDLQLLTGPAKSKRAADKVAAEEAKAKGIAPDAAPEEVQGEVEIREPSQASSLLAQPERVQPQARARGPIASQGEEPDEGPKLEGSPLPIEQPEALIKFFNALRRTENKLPKALTRVAHFGDSVVVSDFVSTTLRRNLQQRFGDGGHGFSLIANAWPAYFHNDVERYASSGWRVSRIVGPTTQDSWYGLGGVSFRAPPGTRARFGTVPSGNFGRHVARFDIAYVKEPGAGSIKINLNGKPHGEISTASGQKEAAFHSIQVPDGHHQLELITKGPGFVRAFGVVMEREGPGVVLDALGVLGARIRFLDKQDQDHFQNQLRWRSPNLVVYQFGANESGDGYAYPMDEYNRTMREVIQKIKATLPESSCLIIGAMDRARVIDQRTESMKIIELIVKEQQAVAKEVGCGFFNTFLAMGGKGSMQKWVRRGWGAGDLTHPTSFGAQVLGDWIFAALMHAYAQYSPQAEPPPR